MKFGALSVGLLTLGAPVAAQQRADTLGILAEIRSEAWVARTPGVLHRAYVGGLQVALVRESSEGTLLPLSKPELAPMHLTEARAFQVAIRNLRARLVPFSVELPAPTSELSGMYSIEGKSIETSRLLLVDDWRELERRLGGPIVVVAPTTGTLIFGRDTIVELSRRKSAPAPQFLELAAGMLTPYGKREDALAAPVLRYTSLGWRVVPPMTAAERRALTDAP